METAIGKERIMQIENFIRVKLYMSNGSDLTFELEPQDGATSLGEQHAREIVKNCLGYVGNTQTLTTLNFKARGGKYIAFKCDNVVAAEATLVTVIDDYY